MKCRTLRNVTAFLLSGIMLFSSMSYSVEAQSTETQETILSMDDTETIATDSETDYIESTEESQDETQYTISDETESVDVESTMDNASIEEILTSSEGDSDNRYINIRLIREMEPYTPPDVYLSTSYTNSVKPSILRPAKIDKKYGVYSFSISDYSSMKDKPSYLFINGERCFNKLYYYHTHNYINTTDFLTADMSPNSTYINQTAETILGLEERFIWTVPGNMNVERTDNQGTRYDAMFDENYNCNLIVYICPLHLYDENGNFVTTINSSNDTLNHDIDTTSLWRNIKLHNTPNGSVYHKCDGPFYKDIEPQYLGIRDSLDDMNGVNYEPGSFLFGLPLKKDAQPSTKYSVGLKLYLYRDYKKVILKGNGATKGGSGKKGDTILYYGTVYRKGERIEPYYCDLHETERTPAYIPLKNYFHPYIGQTSLNAIYPMTTDYYMHIDYLTQAPEFKSFDSIIPVRPGYQFVGYSSVTGTYQEELEHMVFLYSNGKLRFLLNEKNPYYVVDDRSPNHLGNNYESVLSEASFYLENDVTRLYAVWENADGIPDTDQNYITYNMNGAVGQGPLSKGYELGTSIKLPNQEGSHFLDFEFLGWDTNPNATVPTYHAGETYTITETKTLYAIWKDTSYPLENDILYPITPGLTSSVFKFTLQADAMVSICIEGKNNSIKEYPYGLRTIHNKPVIEAGTTQEISDGKIISDTQRPIRRVQLKKGTYYFYLTDPKGKYKSDTAEYNIFINVYRSGFDLTRDACPVLNSSGLYPHRTKENDPTGTFYYRKETIASLYNDEKDQENALKETFDGNCLGMCWVAAMVYQGYLKPEDLEQGQSLNSSYDIEGSVTADGIPIGPLPYYYSDYAEGLRGLFPKWSLSQQSSEYDDMWKRIRIEFKPETNHFQRRWKQRPDFNTIIHKLKNNNNPMVIYLTWFAGNSYGNHAVVTDTTRKPLDLGDGKYRIYVYDPNYPFFDNLTLDPTRDDSIQTYRQYHDAENKYLEVDTKNNTWSYATSYNSNGTEKLIGNNGQLKSDDISVSYLDKTFINQVNEGLHYKKLTGGYILYSTNNIIITKEDETVYSLNEKEEILDPSIDIIPIFTNGSVQRTTNRLELPKGKYSITLKDGTFSYGEGEDYFAVETAGTVTLTTSDDSKMTLSSDTTSLASASIIVPNGKDDYYAIETQLQVSKSPITFSVSDHKLYVETDQTQKLDITLKTIKEEGELKQISTDELKNLSLDDYLTPRTAEGLSITGINPKGYVYTGSAIKPEVSVYDKKGQLVSGKDYKITYRNNINVSASGATITVTGLGNYEGKDSETFKILPKTLSDSDIQISELQPLIESNKIQKPVPKVMYGKRTLQSKKDFTLAYYSDQACTNEVNPKEIGTYYIKLKGIGNYDGEAICSFQISDKSKVLMSKCTYPRLKKVTFTGNPIEIDPSVLTIRYQKKVLVQDQDYYVSYEGNHTDIGTAYVTIRGNGTTFIGYYRIPFQITGYNLGKAKFEQFEKAFIYTGSPILQNSLQLTYGTETLRGISEEAFQTLSLADQRKYDYVFRYQNEINVGKATLLCKGINAYSGTVKKTYSIKPYNLSKNEGQKISVRLLTDKVPYSLSGAKANVAVSFHGTTLVENQDYTLVYQNHKKLHGGTGKNAPTVKIVGKHNFAGTIISTPYQIEKADLSQSGCTLKLPDVTKNNKAKGWQTSVTVLDANGKKLTCNRDYAKTITYTYADGKKIDAKDDIPVGTEIKVTVTGINNYYGAVSGTYRIIAKDINKFKVKVPTKTYTGKDIELTKSEIRFYSGTKREMVTFDIVPGSYENNVNKGKASVTVRGTGDFGGTRKITFTIRKKGFVWWWRK